ncbi:hypothetical protein ACIODT_38455 [Streptomyces sp. NPDC088251]|uniref:hypothetical protein n=1 Tax=unclassified Streptomyces TaxID=2593676 RepID=UPI00380EB5CF
MLVADGQDGFASGGGGVVVVGVEVVTSWRMLGFGRVPGEASEKPPGPVRSDERYWSMRVLKLWWDEQ